MVENKKKIKVRSSREGIHELEAFIEDICYEYNIINTYYSNIQLALNEAFVNARVHGNENDPDKKIDISFFSDQKGLHFLVKDEGDGFDFQNYVDKDISDLPEGDEQGERGILVIKMLVDELNFYDKGSTIELIFYISSINYSLTLERKKHLENYFKNVVLYKTS
ncbi:MAG: ATP-binding protein [Bacteroidales bacterium]|nr:ATP-binding protein [Bacteroidales bacterium]